MKSQRTPASKKANEVAKRLGIKVLLKKLFKIDTLAEIVSQVLQQE
jgi:hypothetical protein